MEDTSFQITKKKQVDIVKEAKNGSYLENNGAVLAPRFFFFVNKAAGGFVAANDNTSDIQYYMHEVWYEFKRHIMLWG